MVAMGVSYEASATWQEQQVVALRKSSNTCTIDGGCRKSTTTMR
jgi:hypothetical protein